MKRKSVDQQFGEQVRVERKHRGWTQPKLAKMLSDKGIEPMQAVIISRIESGDRQARIIEALGIAECFGVSVDALLGHSTDERDDQAYARRVLHDIALRSAQQIHDIANALSERIFAVHGSTDEWPKRAQLAWAALEEAQAALVDLAQSEESE